MISPQAKAFWDALRSAPQQIGLALPERRAAGELAETATSDPSGIEYVKDKESGGLWALPSPGRGETACLYFFGGGYVLGSPASRRKTAGHIAAASGIPVLVTDYRRAPESTFPAPVDDGLDAVRRLLAGGQHASKLFIAGDSSGGGLAVAVALAAIDAQLPRLAGVIALSPWADLTCSSRTMSSQTQDIEVTREGLVEMAGWYLKGADPTSRYASPALADLHGLPPLLCIVGGEERLLDDSVHLVQSAGEAGTDATLFVAGGMQHVFPIWAGAFPEADRAIRLISNWLKVQR
jgi:epsilon-lactone hydrolase